MAQQQVRVSALSAPGSEPFSIAWAGLGSNDFATMEEFKAWVLTLASTPQAMGQILAMWYIGLDPSGSNPSILLNATLTYDDAIGGFTIQVGG